ncbi:MULTISPECIES: ribose 5-phosphate isomerase B [unclassified Paenibacillus]|uniref:ribose 5-phosphate isomerase B n=1 Tax=unclassified Paenibacillus TaxID=185978 RepID=UPI001C11A3B2|nr:MULTISPECIES: ribose 5-phosphate isomerase B [unclassified Paenibacillus]MBU5444187.1 ribose 5-phosphate isomerase B [Paenibacillus sp. MSJ-34]CAH0122535.1 D-erythrulose-4-phosphate isomerase [Paenibacillus sp. CECT 9249]
MKIAIGSDHHGFAMKESIKTFLLEIGVETEDYGCYHCSDTDYPDVAFAVANDIRAGKYERGILICGTGIGVAIAAGKVPGIRAALCHDTYSAERARKSNNAQVLTMGAKVIGPETAKKVVEAWVRSEFEGGNSARKINKIIEQELIFLGGVHDEEAGQSSGCGS